MTFPSRGCRNCKRRRVKCDEHQPACNKCQKSNLVCDSAKESDNFLFLNENEYAIGRKRPRGPNVNKPVPKNTMRTSRSLERVQLLSNQRSPMEPQEHSIVPAMDIPLEVQALAYYSRSSIEVPSDLLEVMDSHTKLLLTNRNHSEPQSLLSLATLSVAYSTFGRARRNPIALTVGGSTYSLALIRTNLALKDSNKATNDEVLLAVMLLSFYENTVMSKTANAKEQGIEVMASRTFKHHDGAIALVNLRREVNSRSSTCTMDVDKLVRRQLLRSLLLRSKDVPSWLRDGRQYGESGLALGLDYYMVEVASLKYRAEGRSHVNDASTSNPGTDLETTRLRCLSNDAQALDENLHNWANNLPTENHYTTCNLQDDNHIQTSDAIFENTVHVYTSIGHAGMWNRYRALRLTLNNIIVKASAALTPCPDRFTEPALRQIRILADDFCASLPYMLDLIKLQRIDGLINVTKVSPSPVRNATAGFLCWPLAMATTVSSIPLRHQQYLKKNLLYVSGLVDDGVLENIAGGFSSKLSTDEVIAA